jgi:hypothetical protein
MAKCLGIAKSLSKIALVTDEMLEAERKCGSQCKKRNNLKTGANKELEKNLGRVVLASEGRQCIH